MSLELFVPIECQKFIHEHPEMFASFGCGPGGVGDYLVPDTVWFLSIRDACRVHDWQYRFSDDASEAARKEHDKVLCFNSARIVAYHTKQGTILFKLRMQRVRTYYHVVRVLGGPSYWNQNRNQAGEMIDLSKFALEAI